MKKRRRRRHKNRQKKKIMSNKSNDKSNNDSRNYKQEQYLNNNLTAMDTTPVNKMKILNRNNLDDSENFCTNFNRLFNNSDTPSMLNNNLSPTNLNTEESKLKNTNKSGLRTTLNLQLNQSLNNKNNLSKIYNNVENNLIIHNQRIILNQADLLDNYCEDYFQEPLYTSSPLYSAIKLTKEEGKLINNKAYKDELNLERLKSFNDITIYATYNVQSPTQIKETNLINISNHLPEKTFDQYKFINSSKLSPPKRKCNKSKTLSENFLHNICLSIISKIKRFNARYLTKWIQNIVSLCTWIGMLKSKKDGVNNRTLTENRNCTECNCEQQKQISFNILITKMDKLISDVELQRKQTTKNTELLLNLKARFDRFEGNFNGYERIKSELEELKGNRLEKKSFSVNGNIPAPPPFPCFGQNQQLKTPLATAPTPPLPPTPPPPPPLPSLLPISKKNIIISKTSKIDKIGKEKKNELYNRPVISEDALKQVKLRKVAERPLKSRRQSEPVISKEMLSQVKLKPVNTRQKPLIQKGNTIDSDNNSVSPRSNLNRILLANASLTRVKRLRKDRNSTNFYDNSRSLRLIDRERSIKNMNNV